VDGGPCNSSNHGGIYIQFLKMEVPPKWMVYNGKPYKHGRLRGTTISRNLHMVIFDVDIMGT
jgi:hypothetical protein